MITDVICTAQTPSTTTPTSNGSIPLTGLLWWPVDLLAILGLILFTLSRRKRFGARGRTMRRKRADCSWPAG